MPIKLFYYKIMNGKQFINLSINDNNDECYGKK